MMGGVAGTHIIYLDVVLLVNLFMDYIILWATARLSQAATSPWRLLGGAALGSLYSLTIFSPAGGPWMWFAVKILVSLLMVSLAFFPVSWHKFLQGVGYFYLVSFVMGGAVLGALYLADALTAQAFTGGGVVIGPLPYGGLAMAVGAALFLVYWGSLFIKRNFWQSLLRLPIVIGFNGKRLALKALVDTGNNLRDPFTGRPVIVAEYGALRPLLPPELQLDLTVPGEPELEKLVSSLHGTPWAARIRVIPFHSLGREHGLLLGFKPDEVVVLWEDRLIRVKDVVIGLCWQRLNLEGGYRALLHPDLLQV
ncbi:sporulation sigma-E factor-processing peptidase [Thermanaeromonas sp. C210]|nr:sporulation sigma-E factor-processing peptidase [Thermanaeromonas sp. C210]